MMDAPLSSAGGRFDLSAFLGGAIEVVVLALVCASPWALGSVEPGAEFCLFCGLAFSLILWAVRWMVQGSPLWAHCPATLGLAGLFLFTVFQLLPLPSPFLACVSPATARLSQELLPSVPEALSFGEAREACLQPAGATISLYPATTRLGAIRLLAVFLLFAVVRNNIATPAATRRLAVAALANGALLAVFAFIQFFSSPPKMLYWTYPVLTGAFGPFSCRDHYPFYLNMCIGLGGGLLLSLMGKEERPSTRRGSHRREKQRRTDGGEHDFPARESVVEKLFSILQSPGVCG